MSAKTDAVADRRTGTWPWWGVAASIVLMLTYFGLSPAWSMAAGLTIGLSWGAPYGAAGTLWSRRLLQSAVVLLGFRLDAQVLWQTSAANVEIVAGTVVGALLLGLGLGRLLKIDSGLSSLISAGTAICGGSAIAALAPVIRARSDQVAVAIAVVFALNGVALFLFPPVGRWFGLTDGQFALWAAIAIHDTSSVVGAAARYGGDALTLATTLKLSRALWIVPVVVAFAWAARERSAKVRIPPFIPLFVCASLAGTWLPQLWSPLTLLRSGAASIAQPLLLASLFLIGAEFTRATVRRLQPNALVQAVVLWIAICAAGLALALNTT